MTTAIAIAGRVEYEFAELVRAHQSMVYSLAWHFLHDRDSAEEVAQEAFLSLHQHLGKMESPEHLVHWLRRVTVQRAIDESRKRQRRRQVALECLPELAARQAPHDPLLGEVLRKLIATLAEAPRAVMILRYQEDLDPTEIAEILNMPIATVKSHLHRSLTLLREKLERRGVGEA